MARFLRLVLPSRAHATAALLLVVLASLLVAAPTQAVAPAATPTGEQRDDTAATAEASECEPVVTARKQATREFKKAIKSAKQLKKKIAKAKAKGKKAKVTKYRTQLKRHKRVARRTDFRRDTLKTSSLEACLARTRTTEAQGDAIHGRLGISADPETVITVGPTEITEELASDTARWLTPGFAMGLPFDASVSPGAEKVTLTKSYARPLPPGTFVALLYFDTALEMWRPIVSSLSRDRRTVSAVVELPPSARAARRLFGSFAPGICMLSPACSLVDVVSPEGSVGQKAVDTYNDAGVAINETVGEKIRAWDEAHGFILTRGLDALGGLLPNRFDPPTCDQNGEEPVNGVNGWATPDWVLDVRIPGNVVGLEALPPLLWCVGTGDDDTVIVKTVNNRAFTVTIDSQTNYLDDSGLLGGTVEVLDTGSIFGPNSLFKVLVERINSVGGLDTLADELIDMLGAGRMILPGETIEHTFTREQVEDWEEGERPLIKIGLDPSDFFVGMLVSELQAQATNALGEASGAYSLLSTVFGCIGSISDVPELESLSIKAAKEALLFAYTAFADCAELFLEEKDEDQLVSEIVDSSVPLDADDATRDRVKAEARAQVKSAKFRAGLADIVFKALSYLEAVVDMVQFAGIDYYTADVYALPSDLPSFITFDDEIDRSLPMDIVRVEAQSPTTRPGRVTVHLREDLTEVNAAQLSVWFDFDDDDGPDALAVHYPQFSGESGSETYSVTGTWANPRVSGGFGGCLNGGAEFADTTITVEFITNCWPDAVDVRISIQAAPSYEGANVSEEIDYAPSRRSWSEPFALDAS